MCTLVGEWTLEGWVHAHLPANSEKHVIEKEECRGTCAEFWTRDWIVCLGKQSRNENVADTLAGGTPHHKLSTASGFDEQKTEEGKYKVGYGVAGCKEAR